MLTNKKILLLIFLPASLLAQPAERLDRLQTAVQRADIVVKGTVKSIVCQWDDDHKLIFSHITLDENSSVLRGQTPTGGITFRMVGGSVGKIHLTSIPSVQYEVGESVVLFLRPDARMPGHFLVVPWGKYKVDVNPQNSKETIYNDSGNPSDTKANRQTPFELENFSQVVRSVPKEGARK